MIRVYGRPEGGQDGAFPPLDLKYNFEKVIFYYCLNISLKLPLLYKLVILN